MTKKQHTASGLHSRLAPVVDLIFDDIPYSPETDEAQAKISSALDEKYRELCKSKSEGEAVDAVLAEYGSLTQMAELAGYTAEQALAWRDSGDAAELRPPRKLMWKQRLRTYAAA